MTPAQLQATGRLLYGDNWKGPLARALGINKRVVQRWANGQWEVPETVEPEIRQLQRDAT